MGTFTGSNADDSYVGTVDADTASGNGGNDGLFGLGGNDSLDGGDGDDTLDGGDANDILTGGAGKDGLSGGNGDDTLYSHAPDPAFSGFLGRGVSYDIYAEVDTLTGGSGNDYLFAGYGDSVDGGAQDTYGDKLFISFRGATSGVTADFRLLGSQSSVTIGGGTITNVEEVSYIEGSEFADLLASWSTGGGYTAGQAIYGRGGNDQIYAGYYAGWAGTGIYGGDGDDLIDLTGAQYGPSTYGDAGDDHIIGGSSYERLDGGEGNDRIEGNYGFDTIFGGAGNDIIDGGSFDDTIEGGAGDDTIYGAGDVDTIDGGDGNDVLYGDYSLISSGGAISGAPRIETLRGGAGNDILYGDEGNDSLDGGIGDDTLYGGTEDDSMTGGSGVDRMEGGAGNDTGYGGDGNDLILSGTGNDQLSGEGDNDRLYFGADFGSSDLAAGGAGYDQLLLQGNYAALTLSGSNIVSVEAISLLSAANSSIVAAPGGTFSYNVTTTDSLVSGSDLLRVEALGLGAGETLSFDGSAETSGSFTVFGGAGSDLIRTGAGDDFLNGGGGADTLRGGLGDDEYNVDNIGDVVEENAGEGEDKVVTTLATYSLFGTQVEILLAGNDLNHDFRGSTADNTIIGGAGNDVLRLYDGGDDFAYGGAGNDNIFFIGALTSADVVNGGAGVDTLVVQGPYGSLTLTADITQIENVSILGGNNTNFGEPGTNRYDYVLTTNDANFAAGVQARINGAALLEGEDFTFDGSAETDASYVVYGGKGKDTLLGGLGNDIFFYAEERFASGDTVNGGAGYDGMFLRGNYTIDFNAPGYTGLFTNIENLTLTSATDERYARGGGTEFDYNLTLSDAIIGAGQELTVSGALLMASETMILDGSQETDGRLRVFGGKANDILKGGGQVDLLHGNFGADTLSGGGGADAFRYQNVAESNSASMDQILDFTPGTDKIELDRIDANTLLAGDQAFTWIGSSAFTGSAGELRAYQSGAQWIVEGDVNGDGAADLVIALTLQGPTPLGANDFLL